MNGVARKKINLFVGSDIVSHREMGPIVAHLNKKNIDAVLYYPAHKPSSNPNASQDVFKDYVYFERKILQEVIYPFLQSNPAPKNTNSYTPKQTAKKYGLANPVAVESINDATFLAQAANDPLVIGSISLRCTQMFGAAATGALKANNRFLLNLHSGILPDFRGLYSTPRAMFEMMSDPASPGEFGCTLHHVDAYAAIKGDASTRYNGIDTGNIVEINSRRIDPNRSVYATNIDLAAMGANAVIKTIDKYLSGDTLRGYPQDERRGRYYSYASPEELDQWQDAGLRMYDTEEVIRTLIETFSVPGSEHAADMESTIRSAINDHKTAPIAYNASQPLTNGNGSPNGSGNGNGHGARNGFGAAVTPSARPTRTTPRAPDRSAANNGGLTVGGLTARPA